MADRLTVSFEESVRIVADRLWDLGGTGVVALSPGTASAMRWIDLWQTRYERLCAVKHAGLYADDPEQLRVELSEHIAHYRGRRVSSLLVDNATGGATREIRSYADVVVAVRSDGLVDVWFSLPARPVMATDSARSGPDAPAAPAAPSAFEAAVRATCTELADLLVAKNRAYGNSAFDPVRCFSRASPVEQLKVRIDDRLSRLMRGHALPDESLRDAVRDLMGHLVLLEVAERTSGSTS